MIKRLIRALLLLLGYEVHKISVASADHLVHRKKSAVTMNPRPIDPIWPLPRHSGFTDKEIRKEFARFDLWHYAYAFEGGLTFPIRHLKPDSLIDDPKRHTQRFRHCMPYLIESQNGSLKGKRVLDIACNSGYWSIQCALLGADVVGFDARPELIAQANLIKSIVGVHNVEFSVLDIEDMNPKFLGGTFDIVLNMGILFHVSNPLEALKLSKMMSHKNILLDTAVFASKNPFIKLLWEEPVDTWTTRNAGIVTYPSKRAIDMMLMHCGVTSWFEIPLRFRDLPIDYRKQRHASWIIEV
jgi:2-polyprenyl-3-methyl-5-hydroxy-6-metoxy-1,4-benzoquinol methylase